MKKYLKRIWSFIKTLFTNPEKWINEYVIPSIQVVELVKSAVDSPLTAVLTSLIPGQLDDMLRERISTALGVLIESFTTGLFIVESTDSVDVKLEKFIAWIKTLPPVLKAAVYGKLASRLAKIIAGDDDAGAKNYSVDLLTQMAYAKIKSGVIEDTLPIVKDANLLDIPRAL